jgi:branched-subunit amino acid ABC-type transport system permease component
MGKLLTDQDCLFTSGVTTLLTTLGVILFFEVRNLIMLAGMEMLITCVVLLVLLQTQMKMQEARTQQQVIQPQQNNLVTDKRGILMEGMIAIVFIIASSLTWLVGALILNQYLDSVAPYTDKFPQASVLSMNVRNSFGIVIVVVDGLLLFWWGLQSFRRERQEYESPPPAYN